jgi:hypothetical protein
MRVQHGAYDIEWPRFHGVMANGVKLQGEALDERRIRLLIDDGIGCFDAEGIHAVVEESGRTE